MGGDLDRLRWRCRRGLLELDLVLSRFLEKHLQDLDESQRGAMGRLLQMPDNDLWDLLSGRTEAADPELAELVHLMR